MKVLIVRLYRDDMHCMAESETRVLALEAENARLRAEIEKLKALVEELQRRQHRPHAPFSKGPPKSDPQPPGRKPGDDYGTKAFRQAPNEVDESYDAPLPRRCPLCGGGVESVGTAEQFQTEIPRRPIRRQFNVHIGRCTCCGKRIQGRHPLQTSDALGAAASQLGPDAQALATVLNKTAGLSHGKIQRVFQTAFGITFARGASAQIMLRAARRCGAAFWRTGAPRLSAPSGADSLACWPADRPLASSTSDASGCAGQARTSVCSCGICAVFFAALVAPKPEPQSCAENVLALEENPEQRTRRNSGRRFFNLDSLKKTDGRTPNFGPAAFNTSRTALGAPS